MPQSLANDQFQAMGSRSRGTALVVDDEAANRRLLEVMLQREGFNVVMASNGAIAVEIFASMQIDIVFMDVMMPVMGGYEATKLIKAHAGDEFIPVIFLTALNDTDAIVNAVASGGDDLLGKPFNFAVLNARIRAMERVRDLHRTIAEKHTALCILHEQAVDDQNFAQQIFQRVLTENRQIPNCVNYFQQSAGVFCGDLVLSARLSDGRIRVLVADFTGHGLAAAVGSIPVADVFKRANEDGLDDFTLLCHLNSRLNTLLPSDVFMAACLVTFCQDGFYYWNGGMPSSFLKLAGGIHELSPEHLALGILPTLSPEERPRKLDYREASALVIYSDGLIEGINCEGAQLSEATVIESLKSCAKEAKTMLASLEKMACMHIGQCDLRDDISVVVIDIEEYRRNTTTSHEKNFIKGASIDLRGRALEKFEAKSLMFCLSEYNISDLNLSAIELITTELVNNAIDHGVLRLDSKLKLNPESFSCYYENRAALLNKNQDGKVSVSYSLYVLEEAEIERMTLIIKVVDSGDGFLTSEWLSRDIKDQVMDRKPWGRGISMVTQLCERLDYNNIGNSVTAVYSWTQ